MKRKIIGLVSNFFNKEILKGARAYAEQNDILLDARWSVRGEWTPKKPGWDGVIYSVIDDKELLERIRAWKIPKVFMLPGSDDEWIVAPDYKRAGELAANELIETKVKAILHLVVSTRDIDQSFAEGVEEQANKEGIECRRLETNTASIRALQKQIVEEIKQQVFPLGFALPHAGVAYSVQREMQKAGIRIPEDVRMVVIDKDVQLTPELALVPITSVKLNDWHNGFVAAEMVQHLIEGSEIMQQKIKIPPKGIEARESTGQQQVTDDLVARALSFVRKNYARAIDVNDVVAATGASRRLVEMRFREVLNRGIHEEITRLRIEEAKRLILNREGSITDIAERCGFSSVHYFSVAFKRETGISPKKYQQQDA